MEEVPRLFVDMDGTLAIFNEVDTLETLYEEGYFKTLLPQENVVEAIRKLIHPMPDVEIYILSSYLLDSKYALKEKNEWLDQYLPEIDDKHRIFLPCGESKAQYIPEGIRDTDVLFDDYTQNLMDWEPPAIGVKCLNGINHTRGSWQGRRCSIGNSAGELADKLTYICMQQAVFLDEKPKIRQDIKR